MIRFDHIVLFLTEETVLRGKQAGKPAGKNLLDYLPAVPEISIRGRLIAQQGEFLAGQPRGRGSLKLFDTDGDHANIRSNDRKCLTMILHLFNGHAFGQVSWLINITTAPVGDLIGEELGGHGIQQRIQVLMHLGKVENIICQG